MRLDQLPYLYLLFAHVSAPTRPVTSSTLPPGAPRSWVSPAAFSVLGCIRYCHEHPRKAKNRTRETSRHGHHASAARCRLVAAAASPWVSSARRVVFSAATGAYPPGSTSLFLPRRLVGFSCAPVASSALLYIASRECWIGANAEHGRSFPFLIPKSV